MPSALTLARRARFANRISAVGDLTNSSFRINLTLPITPLVEGVLGGVMKVGDLVKATIVCGLLAFFVYSYPLLGQVLLIGILGLVWLSYAFSVIRTYRG